MTDKSKNNKPFKVVIGPDVFKNAKNTDGHLGEKCNNCGGFGFTMGIKGQSLSCQECDKTGVKLPTRRELQTQVSEIKQDLRNLRKAILKELHIQVKTPNGERVSL